MNFRTHALAALAGLSFAAAAWSAPVAVIEGVQAPAWIERDGKRIPAAPGTELRNRDRLLTGAEARLLVKLADGSAVKLGENVQTDLNAMGVREGGIFTAAIDVAKGAFRLTTDIARKFKSKRAINVRVGTITAGIRGTDLWGRSDSERDLVCLLEGNIYVTHPEGEAVELTQALQYYAAEKGQKPQPVGVVEEDKLALWAASTELQESAPVLRAKGAWAVRLGIAESDEEALALYDRARDAGYATRLLPRKESADKKPEGATAATAEGTDDKPSLKADYRYEVLVGPLASQEQARRLADKLTRDLQVQSAAVVKRQAAFRVR